MEKELILKKHFQLVDLLHYDPSSRKCGELSKALIEYQFLLIIASSAFKNIIEGNFEKFDAVVGENACQIRAIKLALITLNDIHRFDMVYEGVSNILKIFNELFSPSFITSLMNSRKTLQEVIEHHSLSLELSQDEMFVIQCFLLSEMKEDLSSNAEQWTSIMIFDKCSPDILQRKYPEITISFLRNLAKYVRKLLSEASVDFLRGIANVLQDSTAMMMFSKKFIIEHNNLSCAPNFWSFKVLFKFALQNNVPLIFNVKLLEHSELGYNVIDEDSIFFKSCNRKVDYLQATPSKKELTIPACIIKGVVCSEDRSLLTRKEWRRKISNYKIMDILLASGASHRQYPNSNLTFTINNQEYKKYYELAENEGFSINKPTTFFMNHIFCSKVDKMFRTSNLPIFAS